MPSFLQPLFLLGGIAVAGPLLLHLLLRNRPKSQVLPTLRFLPATSSHTVAFHKLKNILLLLLRIVIILLVAGAFARPYIKKSSANEDSAHATEGAVFALDSSLSMRASNRWDAAVRRARMILDTLPPDAPVGLVLFNRTPRIVFADTKDRSQVLATLESAKPGYGATDLQAAIRCAVDVGEKLPAENCKIFLISDFQDSGFRQISTRVKIPPKLKLTPIWIDNSQLVNAAITGAQELYTDRKEGRLIRIQAERFGEGTFTGKLLVRRNGSVIASREMTINGGKPEIIEIELDIERAREETVWIELDVSDKLPEDNIFPLLLAEEKSINVLLPSRAENGGMQTNSNPFFQAAIESFGTRIEPKNLAMNQVDAEQISEYPIAILETTEGFSESTAQHIKEYIQNGGSVILFPGKANIDYFMNFFERKTVQWEKVNSESGEFRIVSATCGPGRFSFMDNPGRILLGHPRIFQYLKLNDLPSDLATHIATLDDGSPFLLEWKIGLGAVYLFTTTLDSRDSDFVLRPSFAPFLFKLVEFGANRSREKCSFQVGDILAVKHNPNQTAPLISDLEGRAVLTDESLPRFSQPGFFRINRLGRQYTVQVALEKTESDLRPMNPKRIDSLAKVDSEINNSPNTGRNNPAPVSSAGVSVESSNRFWYWMLLAALVLMAVESLVAARTLR